MRNGITLKNGVEMPLLGFGVFRLKEEERISCVRTAVETGYRLFDTAAAVRMSRRSEPPCGRWWKTAL